MTVILITGAPAVGKTTLLPVLADVLPEKNAFLDGDAVGRTRPLTRTIERLSLIQDNICACADNFASWGAQYFVACFVFPSQERMDRICGKLRDAGHFVVPVALVADEDALIDRVKAKGQDHGQDCDSIQATLGCNASVKTLRGVHFVDTTDASVSDIAERIRGLCRAAEGAEA